MNKLLSLIVVFVFLWHMLKVFTHYKHNIDRQFYKCLRKKTCDEP